MRFEVTPEEAQPPALAMIKYFKRQRMNIKVERPAWPDAPYRTTMVAEKGGRHVLVEAQGIPSYSHSLKELVAWLAVRRHYAEVYIVTADEGMLQASTLREMKQDGVGLYVVSGNGEIVEERRARNAALVVTPDPTLKYGRLRVPVQIAVQKFNETNRKDGLRDMCDIVEGLTEQVGCAACRKGWLKMPEANFQAKDWASKINELSRPEAYATSRVPLFNATFKNDLHSFRGARNLLDHPARSLREDKKRQRQFAERMMQGPRLVSELISLERKVK